MSHFEKCSICGDYDVHETHVCQPYYICREPQYLDNPEQCIRIYAESYRDAAYRATLEDGGLSSGGEQTWWVRRSGDPIARKIVVGAETVLEYKIKQDDLWRDDLQFEPKVEEQE